MPDNGPDLISDRPSPAMSIAAEVGKILVDAGEEPAVVSLALAAIHGSDSLDAVLAGENLQDVGQTDEASDRAINRAYLESIEVTGFRGIGPTSKLELDAGPGLTVVAGRNGSGKSSFAEGLEVLLTGDSWRWKNKPVEWKQGWRNLRHRDDVKVSAEFVVEGSQGRTTIWREWGQDDKDVASGGASVQTRGEKRTDLAGFGWATALDLYRPILSHPELGAIADAPSTLFDTLTSVLGLDDLTAASAALRKKRLGFQSSLKEAKKDLKEELVPLLEASDDDRASKVLEALSGRSWDLDAAEKLVGDTTSSETEVARLRQISLLRVPVSTEAGESAERIEQAMAELARHESTESGRARRLASILKLAVEEHTEHGDVDCPVCGGRKLDSAWLEQARLEIDRLGSEAAEYDGAARELESAVTAARKGAVITSPDMSAIGNAGTAAMASVEAWNDFPEEPQKLVAHLNTRYVETAEALNNAIAVASNLLREREDRWRPVSIQLASWIDLARRGIDEDVLANRLAAAEKALGSATETIRQNRFEPVSQQAIALWQDLRLQSNVQLEAISLAGSGTRRRVDLRVTVDDVPGAALGVVSQGEVNCLALSLFFPRVMLEPSPFGFVVIDDPVQAMDPARVDGLARVLSRIAETKQLVVFTHDDRLPESLRRLQLPHKVLQVTRKPGSVVEVTESLNPIAQYFNDGWAVAKDEDLPTGLASRIVPGFCRNGIEAACVEVVRRRRLGRGESHTSVEDLLSDRKTAEYMALALFDDEAEGGKVLGHINAKWGKGAGDAYRDAQRGAHQGFSGSLTDLVNECRSLAERIRVLS